MVKILELISKITVFENDAEYKKTPDPISSMETLPIHYYDDDFFNELINNSQGYYDVNRAGDTFFNSIIFYLNKYFNNGWSVELFSIKSLYKNFNLIRPKIFSLLELNWILFHLNINCVLIFDDDVIHLGNFGDIVMVLYSKLHNYYPIESITLNNYITRIHIPDYDQIDFEEETKESFEQTKVTHEDVEYHKIF